MSELYDEFSLHEYNNIMSAHEISCMYKCASRDFMQHLLFCREMSYNDWCHSDRPPDYHSSHRSPVGGVCCVAASTDWQDKVMWQYPCACA